MATAVDNSPAFKAELLEQLQRAMLEDAQIMGAPLASSATQLVWGDGNPAAKVVLVGEAPGAAEDKAGRPFVGQAGKLLAECLSDINLNRAEDVWITNLVKHRPPSNRDPKPEEKQLYAPYLEQELAIIQPTVVIPLGRHAGSHFIEDLAISRQHGQAQEIEHTLADGSTARWLIMPFYHPAAALYNPHLLPIIKEDFAKLETLL